MKKGFLEIGIFINCIIILIVYLLSFRWNICLPISFFWLPIILILGTIFHQSLYYKLDHIYSKLVALEIAITSIIFHMIYQIPFYGLYGSDSYSDLLPAKGILYTGSLLGDLTYINDTSYYPMIHILGALFSLLTGLSPFVTAKWLPSLLSFSFILILYIFIFKIFKDQAIALLSILLYATLEQFILFSSLFVRETIALIFMICSLYLYFSAEKNLHQSIYLFLSMICLVCTVIAHHMTSFMLLTLLFIHFIITNTKDSEFFKAIFYKNGEVGININASFLILYLSVLISYWIYIISSPLYSFIIFAKDLFSQEQLTSYSELANINPNQIITLRGTIIYYGFHLFLLIFGAIMSYQLIRRSKIKRVEVYSFSMFLFFCGFIALMGLYFIKTQIFPDRFLAFGWIVGFPPLVYAILRTEQNRCRQVGLALLALFALLNIYMINPMTWDKQYEGIPPAPTEQDYMLVRNFDFSNESIGAHINIKMAFFDVYTDYSVKDIYSLKKIENISSLNWIIINKKSIDLAKMQRKESRIQFFNYMMKLLSQSNYGRNKIYDSNDLAAFKYNAQ